ncbi:MAG: hypothetical protein JWM59_4230 [Verrucomicrobiales bacterium]|nr:hypothetical protein [Verrucomicrobiales bacterium]
MIPLLAGAVYAGASMLFKQAYAAGVDSRAVFLWVNLTGMLMFLPLFALQRGMPPMGEWWKPVVMGLLYYTGHWTTFAAIKAGDVSLVTPLMGTKVVLTALVVSWVSGTALPGGLWMAALLTTVGILILGARDLRRGASAAAVGWCLLSAVIFAVADVLIGHWASGFGKPGFLGATFFLLGVFSMFSARFRISALRVPVAARRYLFQGAVLVMGQSMAMAMGLAWFNDPAGMNILYGTRGLWSLVLVWFAGRWFGNTERHTAQGVMGLRLAGSLLILAAVAVAVTVRH